MSGRILIQNQVPYEHIFREHLNTLRPRHNGRHFADDILVVIFLNENLWILKKISLKYVPYGLIGNMAALVQIMVASNRRQTIIWSNVGMLYWRRYASLGLNWCPRVVVMQQSELLRCHPPLTTKLAPWQLPVFSVFVKTRQDSKTQFI